MKYKVPVLKTEVSADDIEQIASMVNWAVNKANTESLGFRMYKQYDQENQKYVTKFEISIMDWSGYSHDSASGSGINVKAAMESFTKNYQVMQHTRNKLNE